MQLFNTTTKLVIPIKREPCHIGKHAICWNLAVKMVEGYV
uniref:Uncharacterized protein n=1 Tax=Arundo donax TaxID=35708 RepID=A0A0A8Y6C3_ARUDO